jgi:Methyltransferase domain
VHENIAEKYNDKNSQREFSNKYGKYRRTLLSYADGRVLEMGIGTGINLQYYGPHLKEVVGVDWS